MGQLCNRGLAFWGAFEGEIGLEESGDNSLCVAGSKSNGDEEEGREVSQTSEPIIIKRALCQHEKDRLPHAKDTHDI